MISLMSYYDIKICTTFPRLMCVCVCVKERGACEKIKSEMVVSNPLVWGIFPWYLGYLPGEFGINYLIKGHVPSCRIMKKYKKRKH
jgi:hypothetical protein